MQDLMDQLRSLDGCGYKAYRDLNPCYRLGSFDLCFDRIQGDPFASPSQCRVIIPQSIAQLPPEFYATKARAIALRDYLLRQCYRNAARFSSRQGSGKSGAIAIAKPSQAILERSAVLADSEAVEVRFTVGLPAYGRRIAGQAAIELLCYQLPRWIEASVLFSSLNSEDLQSHLHTIEDAIALRQQLAQNHWVAFIANGSILPRESGISDRPLLQVVSPFIAPESLEVSLNTPHSGQVSGLAIPEGVTLIVGGGFHGKSTLIQAIQSGIYNHIPGDGREQVVCLESAVKIRSEEGRSVQSVDVSPFINNLPGQKSTTSFCTENASGSTSQAASIIEAVEAQAQLLLFDEDTCATNFMIRDRRMQALIAAEQEPITPLIDQVRNLYEQRKVSSILVMGGCGDYFEVADTVIAMTEFRPQNVTSQAKAIAAQYPSDRNMSVPKDFKIIAPRQVQTDRPWFQGKPNRRLKIRVQGLHTLEIGDQQLDLSAHEQWLEEGQLQAIADSLITLEHNIQSSWGSGHLSPWLENFWEQNLSSGLDAINPYPSGNLAQIRFQDLTYALNRLRSLNIYHASTL